MATKDVRETVRAFVRRSLIEKDISVGDHILLVVTRRDIA